MSSLRASLTAKMCLIRKRNKKVAIKPRKRNKKVAVVCYARFSEERWRELCIMDYELRIVVEKVAVSSQEVVKRDTIASYALQLRLSRFMIYCASHDRRYHLWPMCSS